MIKPQKLINIIKQSIKINTSEVAVIKESFTTRHDESDNVDSPAYGMAGRGDCCFQLQKGKPLLHTILQAGKLAALAVLEQVWGT